MHEVGTYRHASAEDTIVTVGTLRKFLADCEAAGIEDNIFVAVVSPVLVRSYPYLDCHSVSGLHAYRAEMSPDPQLVLPLDEDKPAEVSTRPGKGNPVMWCPRCKQLKSVTDQVGPGLYCVTCGTKVSGTVTTLNIDGIGLS